MHLMITGAAGQLGTDLVAAATRAGYDVTGTTSEQLDITDPAATIDTIGHLRPDVVVNAAAWTAVDACEHDQLRAMATNGDGVANVVAAAERIGATVVQISTDYIFDGTKPEPYLESDTPNPQSVYGASKLAGERAARDHQIIRISWVCGAHGKNMVKTALSLADSHETVHFVDDQQGYPSFTADLAPKIVAMAASATPGIFHLTNQGDATWFEFVREVYRCAGHDPERVRPIATAELDPPRPAPRPANSRLANVALVDAGFGPLLRHWREPLAELVDEITQGGRR